MKVVINTCFGGFSLSRAGVERYAAIKGITLYPEEDNEYPSLGVCTYWTVPANKRPKDLGHGEWHSMSPEERQAHNEAYAASHISDRDIPRDDPVLVQVVEEMGEHANGRCAALKVVEIPDGVSWEIDEYDGNEHIAETHRTWE
jgi:hypothetical protein